MKMTNLLRSYIFVTVEELLSNISLWFSISSSRLYDDLASMSIFHMLYLIHQPEYIDRVPKYQKALIQKFVIDEAPYYIHDISMLDLEISLQESRSIMDEADLIFHSFCCEFLIKNSLFPEEFMIIKSAIDNGLDAEARNDLRELCYGGYVCPNNLECH